ncbi:MAG: ZIP family metal transporter [Rhodothermales bacterium]
MVLILTLISAGLVTISSLAGAFVMVVKPEKLDRIISHMISFAVGALLGGAFLHLIPRAFEHDAVGSDTPLYIVGGIMAFFVLERFLHVHHEHHLEGEAQPVKPIVAMSIIGGTMHNTVDGMIVAASYAVSVEAGIVTTAAILLHQIPQEIGDFGILVHGGLTPFKALLYNLGSGGGAIVGAVIGILVGSVTSDFAPIIVALTAGSFIYIAASDLIPELRRSPGHKASFQQLLLMAAGVGLMLIPRLIWGH